jgi:RND family efflux transporter MFP subunit
MTPLLKVVAPVVIVLGGFAGARWLNETAPQVPAQVPEMVVPLVEIISVQSAPRTLQVHSHGEAKAARHVQLVAEVSARVIWVAPELEAGDFVSSGTPLIRFDTTDYELAEASAEARLAQTQAALQLEEAEAEIARADWAEHGEGPPPALVAREPQLARAQADVRATQASLDAARRDLARCEIRAPFDARVETRAVTVASFVAPGQGLCQLADNATAEVMVPVRLNELAYLDLSLGQDPRPLSVRLRAQVAGEDAVWQGQVVRTGASLDPRNRMASLVVRVDAPYSGAVALIPGTFVQATVEGRTIPSVHSIPRSALRDDGTVLLLDAKNLLEIRLVTVFQRTGNEVLIDSGLRDGDRLITTPLVTIVPGMPLRTSTEG